jgi:bla regulator protein blaR1
MTPAHLSEITRALTPGLGNHLWQSTLFAVAAGLLTLILRKNHAQARYRLWLAASVKFLIPFSLLVSLGNRLAWSHAVQRSNAGLYFVDEVSQPFTQPAMSSISLAAPSTASQSLLHLLPAILAAVWLLGFAAVLLVWCLRWRGISAALREAAPLLEGREVEALRRLERMAGLRRPMEMVSSRASLEPGVFGIGMGIARPVLIWPEGISAHLEAAHLEAVLAHELWHVRRRDNLAAAIHMVVEALFWFHPLVWWLGARLVEERERACDEQVLEMGSERQVYAESILKVCEFCVGSPLACVSGVTGSDLKKRMVNIMTERIARKLDFSRKLLLSTAAALALALPIVFGLANATQSPAEAQAENGGAAAPAYQSASIRPHQPENGTDGRNKVMFSPQRFSARGATLQTIIQTAYGVQPDLISGAPDWATSQKFDVDVTLPGSAVKNAPKPGGIGIQNVRTALQALLADRFKLTLHRETKDLSVYELVVAEGGPKLQEAKPAEMASAGIPAPPPPPPPAGPTADSQTDESIKPPGGPLRAGLMQMDPGKLINRGATLEPLVEQLSWQLGRSVLDKTGLTGMYDFTLQWTPDPSHAVTLKGTEESQPSADSIPSGSSGPTLFTALEEQLGLKLVPQKASMQVLVIDHVEPPAEN